jgi:hypothetical protein
VEGDAGTIIIVQSGCQPSTNLLPPFLIHRGNGNLHVVDTVMCIHHTLGVGGPLVTAAITMIKANMVVSMIGSDTRWHYGRRKGCKVLVVLRGRLEGGKCCLEQQEAELIYVRL